MRKSNYELSKIGTNLNQVAKAFHLLVKAGERGKMPEIGKKMASLWRDITEHTGKVLRVLNAGTAVWES
ncbi:MAG: MobC family plasmid mobilization relaxosome protein [Zoogloeaceae bacterium]|nr:MobC family plasmid mobilization relaxosome protein [Zoogloeaceae bacterium]